MNTSDYEEQINNFESHYQYDSTYMRELLAHSPAGFAKFNQFLPLSAHIEKLSPEQYWVAKLATMQVEDCGDCLQLNVKMALEAGVARDLLETVLTNSAALPDALKDIYDYAACVAGHEAIDEALMDRIKAHHDKGALLEFALCIASAKVFATIKRALGYARACRLVEIAL